MITTINNKENPYLNEINTKFLEYNWERTEKYPKQIIYSSPKNITDQFIITINEKDISVSIPLKNKNYNYKTTLNNYFTATEYILNRLNDFIN